MAAINSTKETEKITKPGAIAAYVLIGVFGIAVLLLYRNPTLFIPFIAEDKLVENLEVLFLFLALDIFILAYFLAAGKKETRWLIIIAALFALFLGLEELDWLQRLITRFMPIHVPDIFTAYGGDRISVRSFLRSEVWFGKPGKSALHLVFMLWGIVLPALGMMIPKLKKYLQSKNFPYPPVIATVSVAAGLVLSLVVEGHYLAHWSRNAFFCWEIADFYAYFALLLASASLYLKIRSSVYERNPFRSSWALYVIEGIALIQLLILGMIFTGPGMWPPPTGGRPLSRTDLAFYTTLGSYHYEKGELDIAGKELETAAERRWPDPFTYLNLARVYAAQGRYDNASSELKRALYCCAGNVRLQKMVFKEQLAIAEKTGDKAAAEQIRKSIEEIEGGRIRQD